MGDNVRAQRSGQVEEGFDEGFAYNRH